MGDNLIQDEMTRRVLVLSDNDGLSRAIKLNLNSYLDVQVVNLAPSVQQHQSDVGQCDLMIVAMSSSTSEPIVALTRASLTEHVGQVPLLIISDRPFRYEPEDHIAHLEFPFEIDTLRRKVKEMLRS